ncbi:RNA ligase RtcB family protein [Endozoicomonas sp. SM1973]|uniref:3'-phosphate/5'-hydroxy nucleic acid ligase n=1 Tax=Spartinivicinus marinus TaxID=2994442 RepID=A0A853I1Z6_9GAMM|nr:RNA ligase RtcB family protein [Spartinivicinus marinus]MCX4027260.1 RNA ligase RtcB family protein [Spartinivicinus marinus]NYZ67980.1 RNA ligase RtcB family protein [Spartinivicinus marinus]
MGTFNAIKQIEKNIELIASDKTWIEGKAIEQLKFSAKLPDMLKVAGMPDLHPGKSYPIGAAFLSKNTLYPYLVGSDIGCGMGLWQTDKPINKVKISRWIDKLSILDDPLDLDWLDEIEQTKQQFGVISRDFDQALGSIGGGNHFAELQIVDTIFDQTLAEAIHLSKKHVQLLVHSGSRGYGHEILNQHIAQFNSAGIVADSDAGVAYLNKHDDAVRWACANRALIASQIMATLNIDAESLLDVTHNLVSKQNGIGWLHRKGATPSDQGVVAIPGSRGAHTYLVKPIKSATGLFSLAHGAGRKWQRSEAKARLSNKYRVQDLQKTSLGSHVVCKNKALLYEEAPQAYKSIDQVIQDLKDAGLIELIASLKPILTYKTSKSGGC